MAEPRYSTLRGVSWFSPPTGFACVTCVRAAVLSVERVGPLFFPALQVRSLGELGHAVLVVSGAPPPSSPSLPTPSSSPAAWDGAPNASVLRFPLPRWGSLDASCAWEEYASSCVRLGASAVGAFAPEAAVTVDWHGHEAWRRVRAALSRFASLPEAYMNFRVHSRTAPQSVEGDVIRRLEAAAVLSAARTLAVSEVDAKELRHLVGIAETDPRAARVTGLLPPLRREIRDRVLEEETGAEDASSPSPPRSLLLCCVRCSAEKEPQRFVRAVELLCGRNRLPADVTPLVVGAGWSESASAPPLRGSTLCARLRAACPRAEIRSGFLAPEEFSRLLRATALNVHPPREDAYGMTVAEAAALGAPSLVARGGGVGIVELLRPELDEVLSFDAGDDPEASDALADAIERALRDRAALEAVGKRARMRSLAWSEQAAGKALENAVRECVAGGERET